MSGLYKYSLEELSKMATMRNPDGSFKYSPFELDNMRTEMEPVTAAFRQIGLSIIHEEITPKPFEPDFQSFKKIPRWSRDICVTEKIDGTNGLIFIDKTLNIVRAGSKSHWLFPGKKNDNFGFAVWVEANRADLVSLGPGYHYGEWWGANINRNYGLKEKHFSLFNTTRWKGPGVETKPDWEGKVWKQPLCCTTVPVLYEGPMSEQAVYGSLNQLVMNGSVAVPGFMNPEGIVIFHTAGNLFFKKTIKDDEKPKGIVEE